MRKIFLLGLVFATNIAFSYDEVIQWNYNDRATALGSGCKKRPGGSGDTEFIEAGNEISVVFSRLGVDLSGHARGKRVAKKTCRIIIPTKVRAGWYLATLDQTLTYGYERTRGTEGKVSMVSSFYNQAAGRIRAKIPTRGYDKWSEPFIQKNVSSRWKVRPRWCRNRSYTGNYKGNLAVTGYRRSVQNDIVVQIDGQDIRFDALATPALCP